MRKTGILKNRAAVLFLVCAMGFMPVTTLAQLVGADTAPGASCNIEGAVAMSANPSPPGTGAYVLICNGTQWVATINADTPVAGAQAANKDYVDNTLGRKLPLCTNDATGLCLLEAGRFTADPQFTAGNIADGVNILGVTGTMTGSGCTATGDQCPDDTIFAGYHPTLHVPLYIPPADQGTTHRWKTSTGANDIAVDSIDDGRANSNQVPNNTTFPAFKMCKDLSLGGHSDWYLPSQIELYYLWSARLQLVAKGNITDFQSAGYWSSTEYTNSASWGQDFTDGVQAYDTKTATYRVRCIRR